MTAIKEAAAPFKFIFAYKQCILNNLRKAVIALNFVQGRKFFIKYGICASHSLMSGSFCHVVQKKVQEKLSEYLFFLAP